MHSVSHWCTIVHNTDAQWRQVAHCGRFHFFFFPLWLNAIPVTPGPLAWHCNAHLMHMKQNVIMLNRGEQEQSKCAIQLLWPGLAVRSCSCTKLRQQSNVSDPQSSSPTCSAGQPHGWAQPGLAEWYAVCPCQSSNWECPLPSEELNTPLAVWRRLMFASKGCSQPAWQTPSRWPPVYTDNHSFAADTSLALGLPALLDGTLLKDWIHCWRPFCRNIRASHSQDPLNMKGGEGKNWISFIYLFTIRSADYESGKAWVSD